MPSKIKQYNLRHSNTEMNKSLGVHKAEIHLNYELGPRI